MSRSSVSREVQVNLRGYPWGRALLHHAVVFPLVIVLWVVAAYVFLRRPREEHEDSERIRAVYLYHLNRVDRVLL